MNNNKAIIILEGCKGLIKIINIIKILGVNNSIQISYKMFIYF